MLRIVNLKKCVLKEGEVLIKVDRSSVLGNPFFMSSESERDNVCNLYSIYMNYIVNDMNAVTAPIQEALDKIDRVKYMSELRRIYSLSLKHDIALGCWCYPSRCHAYSIMTFINSFNPPVNKPKVKKPLSNMVFRGEYYFLSNMSPSVIGFKYKGVLFKFKCVESAFQALKCVNIDDMYAFQDMSGSEAKAKGKKVKLKSNWNAIKVSVMHSLLKLKFKDEFKMNMLLNVKCDIVENNSWGDNFWGVYNGCGKNTLGKLLMSIRDNA